MIWTVWWVWLSAALVLAILEVLAPGFILIGFAVGAAVVGIFLVIGGPFSALLMDSLPATLLLFAVSSLVAWYVLRRVVGVRKSQVKSWDDKDVND